MASSSRTGWWYSISDNWGTEFFQFFVEAATMYDLPIKIQFHKINLLQHQEILKNIPTEFGRDLTVMSQTELRFHLLKTQSTILAFSGLATTFLLREHVI